MRRQIMKAYRIITNIFFLLAPLCATAGWQVANPQATIPREPFFQAGSQSGNGPSAYSSGAFPNQYASLGQPAAVFAVSICGSLKDNLERILSRYQWRVIWKAPFDYNFDGRVTGATLQSVVEKLVQPFPLQAVMFLSNRTVVIKPRDITNMNKEDP